VIRIEAIWLATEPLDMRAGTETILARVVKVFGSARPHHAYLFANKNSTRMKVVWRQLQPPLTTTKIAALCCYRG
jgi:transposase